MGILQIGLLLLGLICFVISFFLSEKLSSSDINEFEKMSKADINTIVEKQLREADDGIKVMIDEGMKDALDDFEIKADRMLNSKIMSISDYSDSVIESIEKSHKEIVFMYDRLVEKQEVLTDLTKDIQSLESNLREIKYNIEEEVSNGNFMPLNETLEKINTEEYEQIIAEAGSEDIKEVLNNSLNENNDEDSVKNKNDKIIQMHKEGFDEVEIAKKLGKGLGEIKLVLGLFGKE